MVGIRVLFIFLLGLSLTAVGVGCDGKAKKTPISKAKTLRPAENDKAIQQMIQEGKDCLPLKRLVEHFRAQEESVYSLSTYDVDVGQFANQFTSTADENLRGQVALFFRAPSYVFATGKQLPTSDVFEELLGVTSQEDCKELHIQGHYDEENKDFEQSYKIVNHTATSLLVRNVVTDEIRSYYLNKNSELEVSRYWSTRNPICGKNLPPGQVIKETAVLAWGDALQHVRMSRRYAQLLANHIQEPKELKDKLSRTGGGKPTPDDKKTSEHLKRPTGAENLSMESVSVSYPTYFFILKEIFQRKIENLTCN